MTVLVAADAAQGVGLGHLSRAGAVASALRARGHDVECVALGARDEVHRDGLVWRPSDDLPPTQSEAAVLDSYGTGAAEAAARIGAPVIVMHDRDGVPSEAALTVAFVPRDVNERAPILAGPRYACLRRDFWGLPAARGADGIRRVFVTAGGALDPFALARAAAAALPGVHLTVAAPSGTDPPSDLSLELHVGAASLAGDLLNTDLVVCAGGQTMLEALAAGAPCIAVVMAENQRRQADYLAGLGAVRVSDEAGLSTAVDAVAADPGLRTRMSATGQSLIDGYGAFRVAFAIDRVLALKA